MSDLPHRLRLTYHRPVASSSAPQSALCVRSLMWTQKGIQPIVLPLELTLSRTPWQSELSSYVSKTKISVMFICIT